MDIEEGVEGPIDSPDSNPTKEESSPEAVVSSPAASPEPTDVIRAGDEQQETKVLTSPGGLRSVKDQFEGGNVSNVEVKKMMDDEVIRPVASETEQAAPEGVNTSGISENEPAVRDDVVRAGTPSDDPMSVQGGTRSILDRFEKGEVVKEESDEDSSSSKKVDLTAEIEEAKRREQELERAGPGVSENEPLVRDDVVRSADAAEDIKLVDGGLGSLKDRFEKGAVSNIEQTPKKEPIKIGSLEDSSVNDPAHAGIAESTPIVRDDVVHSSDRAEEPKAKAGTSRSLKAMFEKGPVSNLEERPKEKIDLPVRSLEDDRPAESGISENTPVERDDVVKSTPVKEAPVRLAGLRNLKSMFEQGKVSNAEEKPRQVDQHIPSSLESSAPTDGGISENTPEVREDLVRETSPKDDYKISSGHSRSLKDRWEKGEVERPEFNYKTVVMKEEAIIRESKPEPQREDVVTSDQPVEPVQIAAGSSKNLRDRFEKGEASNSGVTLRVAKDVPKAKRFSAYEPDADGEEQLEEAKEDVPNGSAEQNEAHQNGVQEGQNGIIEDGESPEGNPKDSPQQEMASWEIKAARQSALADGEDATLDH